MLKMPASLAFRTWMSPAVPVSCMPHSACIDTPVAPIGWPLAFRPPDGLTGSLPSFWVQPSRIARAPCPRGVRPIASYSISSATVKQSWVSTKDRSESCMPACARGVFLALGAAELEAKILAHLRIGVGDAVLVVLGRDHRQRVRLVAIFLEIALRDLAEHAGKAADGVAVLGQIGRLQKITPDIGRGGPRHLLDADHQHDFGRTGGNRPDALMHRGRTGCTGVFNPRRRLEAQFGVGLQHQGGREILRREAGIEMSEHDLVDV